MNEPGSTRLELERINLRAVMPWLRLFSGFRMAIRPSRMALALLLVLWIELVRWWLRANSGVLLVREWPPLWWSLSDWPSVRLLSTDMIASMIQLARYGPVLAAVGGVLSLPVVALLGGALARSAAVEATRGRTITMAEALRFSTGHWLSYLLTPLVPLLLVAVVGGVVLGGVFGLLLRLPWVPVVGAAGFGVALLVGLVLALILIGLVIGGILMYPAVACDRADPLDALSRAYNYALGRPWQLLFYVILAVLYGLATFWFLQLVAAITLRLVGGFISGGLAVTGGWDLMAPVRGMGPSVGRQVTAGGSDWGPSQQVTVGIIGAWVHVLGSLLTAYAVSYFFCAQTWIYLLLRRHADGTELDELFEPRAESADAQTGASSA